MDYYENGPDQANAWLVALVCFLINFLLLGMARSTGILYVILIESYGVTRQQAMWPFAIRIGFRNLAGPLIGLLGLRYGIRMVTLAGGVVAAIGSILCYFAPNILYITLFWGVIHGFGFGLSTVIHMMIISDYFDKYKASALGLGYSGDCFGTFAFPVIMEYLIANYGIRGTFLILGAVILNVVPMAMLLKKPPWLKSKRKHYLKNISPTEKVINNTHDDDKKQSFYYKNEAFLSLDENLDSLEIKDSKINQLEHDPPIYENMVDNFSRTSANRDSSSLCGSIRSLKKPSELSDFMKENSKRHDSLPPVFEKEIQEGCGVNTPSDSNVNNSGNEDDFDEEEDTGRPVSHSISMKKRASSFVGQMAQDIVHKMRSASFASQIAQDGFISSLQQEQNEEHSQEFFGTDQNQGNQSNFSDLSGNPQTNNNGQEVIMSIQDLKNTTEMPEARQKRPNILQALLRTNAKPIFVLISMSMAVYAFLFVGVLTVIIDYAVDHDVSFENGKFLIIGFSVTDLIGRLSFGQVIDRNLMKMKNYSGVTMLIMGTLVAAIPLNPSFKYMLVCMCLYGLIQGGTAIMFPILVSTYMEKNEESVAMGCLNFYGGILMLTMAPMIGYFRDQIGSYNGVFYISGGIVALVGIIWQFEPLILRFQNRKLPKLIIINATCSDL